MENCYFEDLVKIQKLLVDINAETLAYTKGEFGEYIFKNKIYKNRIIYNILNIVKYRSSKAIYYSELINDLFQADEQIKSMILSQIFDNTPSGNYEQRVPQIYLLFLLVCCHFYSIETILESLQSVNDKSPHFYLIFAWFCPEIQRENGYFYESIISNYSITNEWPQQLKLFYSQIEKYRENEWKNFIEKRRNGYEKDSIMAKIKCDEEIENLIDYYDKRIRVSIFEVNWILWNYPSYIEFSAFYGSIKNLSFFIENGFNFSEDFQTLDLLSFAIAGGNQRTIDYLLNKVSLKKQYFINSEFVSILFHQNNFIEKVENEKFSSIFGSLGEVACSSNNLYILQKLNLSADNHIDYHLSSIENGESDSALYLILNENQLKISDEFLMKIIQYEYEFLIMKLLPNHSSFLLKNILLLKKRGLFKNIIENNNFLNDEKIDNDLIFLSIFLNEEELFILLIESFPSKVMIKTSQNETLLSLAVQQKLQKSVEFLLKYDMIDVNEADVFLNQFYLFNERLNIFSFWAPIHFAASENLIDIAKLLLNTGKINLDQKTDEIKF
ncbi:hypothetical protein M9Y10_002066 [Tritrichomonas musculus]|uniref:DUF3447 domain-containing protein n=1 Tax=Tritrichomonas musculus TaxID=1915356 RepID=A0ABR2L8S6_9EUKA